MYIAVLLASLMTSGLLVGNELAIAIFIHPVLYTVPEEAHVRVVKPLAQRLGHYMPFWYALSLVFAILQLLVVNPHGAIVSWWFCCAAAVLMALIIILTIVFPVPINNRVAGLDFSRLPDNWLNMRRRWDSYHRVRVILLIVVLSLLIASALLNTRM